MTIKDHRYSQIFGTNLQSVRNEKNLTIGQFSKLIDYNRNSLSKLEYGEQNIRLNTMINIAKNINHDLSMLLSRNFIDNEEYRNVPYIKETNYFENFISRSNQIITSEEISKANLFSEYREQISRILSGHNSNPTIKSLEYIANSLDVNLDELFKEV